MIPTEVKSLLQRRIARLVTSEVMADLVSCAWVAERLGKVLLKILDGSWYLPMAKRDVAREFLACRIPSATRFDIDAVVDPELSPPLPHMLPRDPVLFSAYMTTLGVHHEQTIVVYDSAGILASPRVWYSLRLFGARNVAVLDGGLPEWKRLGLPVESGAVELKLSERGPFKARFDARGLWTKEQVLNRLELGSEEVLVDARPVGRFTGVDPEPRAGLLGGHIPGALNVPFNSLISDQGKMRSPEELKSVLTSSGIDLASPRLDIVASCGSGITACVVLFAAHLAGVPLSKLALYDGSWSEWGDPDNKLPRASSE